MCKTKTAFQSKILDFSIFVLIYFKFSILFFTWTKLVLRRLVLLRRAWYSNTLCVCVTKLTHRRQQLKDCFNILRGVVPSLQQKKHSNQAILKGSQKYIQVGIFVQLCFGFSCSYSLPAEATVFNCCKNMHVTVTAFL